MSFLKLLAAVPLLCLVARAPAVGALPPPSSNCQRKCGDVDIPYPFAIGPTDTPDHCGFPGFNVSCNHTGNGTYKPFRGGVELLNISLEDAQCRVMHFISSSCYNRTAKQMDYSEWQINLSKPYRFSDIRNKFTVIGCRTLAYIDDDNTYTSGCVATCGYGDLKTLANGTCSGIGCCQTSIPVDLKSYWVSFDESMNTSQIYNVTPSLLQIRASVTDHLWRANATRQRWVISDGPKKYPLQYMATREDPSQMWSHLWWLALVTRHRSSVTGHNHGSSQMTCHLWRV